jgi:O-methyltransferase involved in polyketide biosynthesis
VKKNENKKIQIINLGAGFDSNFFRLKSLGLLPDTLFVEIDFPEVINRKINLIKTNENLLCICPDLRQMNNINENFGNLT